MKIYIDKDNRVYTASAPELVEIELSEENLPEFDDKPIYDTVLTYVGGKIVPEYVLNVNKCHGRITELKSFLYEEDYKVTKNFEAEIRKTEPPYPSTLYARRDLYREEINSIENLIKEHNEKTN